MIRIRSKNLLSGVSTLAVMAAFGAATVPAQAAPLVVPAGPNAPVVVTGTTTSSVTIQPGAIVDADGNGNSFTNSGSIFGNSTALWVNNALLSGGVSNTGDMLGNNYGIHVQSNSVIGGNIANGTGTIGGNLIGILIDTSVVSGSLTNAVGGLIGGNTAGVILNNAVMNGSISNAGNITFGDVGVRLSGNSVLVGGIVNDGAIVGFGAAQAGGIELLGAATVAGGGIVNNGFIGGFSATNANGILINTTGALVGNIDNSGTIAAGSASQAVAINLTAGVIAGSIVNSGQITAGTANSATAIRLSGGTLAGNIDNTGLISGQSAGIAITGATVAGQILNQSGGVISATTTSGVAILINGGNLTGGIDNQGSIVANATSGAGIAIGGAATVQNGITNSGVISATGTSGIGIFMLGGTFSGGIENTGEIQAGSTGILIIGTAFTGGITNDGTIVGGGGAGIFVGGTDLNGDVVNGPDALISASTVGFGWSGTNFTGSVLNDGVITAGNQGIIMTATGTIAGDVTNNGDITASSGIVLTAALVDGSVSNTGTISTTGNGINLNGVVSGGVSNEGLITVSNNGIFLNGTIQGALSNTGDITAGTGVSITGQVAGGIANSGNISGTNLGINLAGATAGHTITQTAGSIAAPTALFMVNGDTDTFVGQGGVVSGNISADGLDAFNASGTGAFAYASGTATGLFDLDNNGTGVFVLGSTARGVDGLGVTVTANNMQGNGVGAQFYLDDDTTITLTDLLVNAGDLLEFHVSLPAGVEDAGVINTTNGTITGANVAAYIDPATMASAPIPTTTTLVYNNVISAGTLTGTFANSGTILTSSPFFEGFAQYDGDGTVDLFLNRLAFGDVLVAESHNQQAVGGALETIYTAGGYSGDLQDVFEALFSAATTPEAQAMLIELSGSQHAQVGQAVHNLTNSINGMVRERLDGVVLSQDGVRWAGTPGQRYAQAAAVASDAASASGLRGSQGMTRGASGWSAWGRAFENEINVDSDADASGYDHDSQGGIVGVDYATSPNTTVGASVAYATSDMWFDATPDTADIESWQVNLFGSHGFGRFYVDGQATYAQHDIGTLRLIDLPAPAGSALATASYEASSWSVNGELGAIWRLGRVNMQPSLAVAYVDTSADGFTETSTAGYALNVSGADGESLSTTLALRASGQWMMAKTPVVPDFKIGWRHEYLDDVSSFGASFIDDPAVSMSIVSSKIQADSLVISSGATFGVTKNFEIFFDVNGQYNADASATNASGGLRVTW